MNKNDPAVKERMGFRLLREGRNDAAFRACFMGDIIGIKSIFVQIFERKVFSHEDAKARRKYELQR